MVSADGVVLRAWRQANELAPRMVGARLDKIIVSKHALISLLDAITLVLRDGVERTLKAHVKIPGGVVHRRLIIHPFNDREIIISAKPIKHGPSSF